MQKTFIGPHLRRLRMDRGETRGAMARALGISTSHVNLPENNERSVSVPVLLKLFEVPGIHWRAIAEDEGSTLLADLRAAVQDPLFDAARPDLARLRAALVHAPDLATAFLRLHRAWQGAAEQVLALSGGTAGLVESAPEAAVHDSFRRNRNHFRELEEAAAAFRDTPPEPDEVHGAVKRHLRETHGLRVRLMPVAALPDTLREPDEARGAIRLSEALDHPNRVFQLVHVAGPVGQRDRIGALVDRAGIADPRGQARLRVALANCFAAAALMPCGRFIAEARASKYDLDHLATRFGVSLEQACHRATTLQREGDPGVPFFFLRIDKAGNVTNRFNSTGFPLAEHGGACPRLDVHTSFRTPGRIVTQFVEMPDASRSFVVSRTVDRPTPARQARDNRLAVAMGCTVEHVPAIGYAEGLSVAGSRVIPVGINCRVCPRANCDQRAHHALILTGAVDERRRGATRYGV